MSYAKAPASSSPTGAPQKLPKSAELEVTTESLGSIQFVDADTFEQVDKVEKKAQQNIKEKVHSASKKGKKAAREINNEAKELNGELGNNPLVTRFLNCVRSSVACATSKAACLQSRVVETVNKTFSTETVSAAYTELQNPVVVGQLAVLGAGATAGWFVYAESDRIRSDNKYVVALHAGVVTALVLADVYVFLNLYAKNKK
ncbi:hypothetical protein METBISCDRAFT_26076 [Metschnikowia bicuspidata]|uniref:Mitochondrial outer membrane protein OM14 C-terminal domain-containing protein n=1 Tax=Metschnikowia bicuspidata TaxID=27322 RepID=A0A4P9ZGB1_9ASCO|nr:hypothetical protein METBISCDRAFT_26076 [Metschnikowia bicuspidata]